MLDDLGAILRRTGRYNLTDLSRRLADTPHPVSRRELIRWFHGHSTPWTTDAVERVALAAGIDLAYLLPDDPSDYLLDEDDVLDVIDQAPAPSVFSRMDLLAHREERWPSFDTFTQHLTRGLAAAEATA